MTTDPVLRRIWYQWFIYRWVVFGDGGGHGVTPAKLRRHEETILADDLFWQDIILRHGFADSWPWEAMEQDKPSYDHAMGNFWGMTYPLLMTGQWR